MYRDKSVVQADCLVSTLVQADRSVGTLVQAGSPLGMVQEGDMIGL